MTRFRASEAAGQILPPAAFRRAMASANNTTLRLGVAPCALVLVFLSARGAHYAGVPIAICLMKQLCGLPCPGCGITTSIAALLAGDMRRAIAANVAGPLVVAFFVVQSALTLAAAMRAAPDPTLLRISRFNDRALSAVLLIAWCIQRLSV